MPYRLQRGRPCIYTDQEIKRLLAAARSLLRREARAVGNILEHLPYASGLPPLRTLGDLRRAADAQLLKEPNVGRKLLTQLRKFCPASADETLERLFAKVRALPPERKAVVIDALTKICESP